VWKLLVADNATTTLFCEVCEDGNDHVVTTKDIAYTYTDLPAPRVELWVTGNVIYLPSAH
jgi:hypothetical protein